MDGRRSMGGLRGLIGALVSDGGSQRELSSEPLRLLLEVKGLKLPEGRRRWSEVLSHRDTCGAALPCNYRGRTSHRCPGEFLRTLRDADTGGCFSSEVLTWRRSSHRPDR